ncbi:helix-turn-helix domain-containing protein [Arachnia propionica]|uniref:Helix-turn-helix domain-containing protein n=1 Tax=Arachnia propionica TaxID=1750 RepID=A0A3P1T6Q2_9ACTN|nr:helix-turn-helix domain-containing protein [Arachnia propionica]
MSVSTVDTGGRAAPLSRKVREARKARGWSQTELATHAGVSRLTVTRLEAGKSVSSSTLLKVADSLGLRLALHE